MTEITNNNNGSNIIIKNNHKIENIYITVYKHL